MKLEEIKKVVDELDDIVIDYKYNMTQEKLNDILDYCIKKDLKEEGWRLAFNYPDLDYTKLIDYFVGKRDYIFLYDLEKIIDKEHKNNIIVRKVIDTQDSDFIKNYYLLFRHDTAPIIKKIIHGWIDIHNNKRGKVILISGNKRAGKTTLSVKLQKEAGFNYYNFDNIMDVIEDEFNVDCVDKEHYFTFLESFVEFMLEHAKNYRINSVIDTIYYMPSGMDKFKYKDDIEVYYLANLDATEENIKPDFKKYSMDYDWPSYVSDEDIERNVKFILERNELLKKECKKYGYKLINTSREENRDKVINELFNEIVNK